jgi:mono/diheme cytochrome c family protein
MNTRAIVTLFGAGLLLSACNDEPEPIVLGQPGPIPPSEQRAGDPEDGYHTLLNRGYVSCGIPYEAFRRTADGASPDHPLPNRSGRNTELPYNLNATTNADGVELVVSNCLICHGGEFDGKLVIGLGNEFLDFSEDPLAGVESIGLAVSDGAEAVAWSRWADRIGTIAPYMITDTFGVNPAPHLTMALMAHRDPEDLTWHPEPRLEPPSGNPLPVSVPPWWRMVKKHAMFYHGGGRGDHARFMMMKALVCTDDTDEAERIHDWFVDLRAYIASLEPPDYPYPIDTELADQGRAVFERTCSACHGRYGEEPSYPNLIVGLDEIGTDPAYAEQAVEAERFIRWFNRSFYGQNAEARPAAGYVAPPLDAVWATAPYLHNGSVPNLAALLDSSTRPTWWRHQTDPREYDTETLGWRHVELNHGKEGAVDDAEARMIYDTTRYGYGNGGHTFGDTLDDAERRAVLEYLKTL